MAVEDQLLAVFLDVPPSSPWLRFAILSQDAGPGRDDSVEGQAKDASIQSKLPF